MELKAGDKVRVKETFFALGHYEVGDVLTVYRVDNAMEAFYVEEHAVIMIFSEVEAIV